MRIKVKDLLELKKAKDIIYEEFNRLNDESKAIMVRMQRVSSAIAELKLEEKLLSIIQKLQAEDIEIKRFWEQIRERFLIFYPWQLDSLLAYIRELRLGELDTIEYGLN